MIGKRGAGYLLVIPAALVEFQSVNPGALVDRGLRASRQIAILRGHPVQGAELDRRGRLGRIAAERKRHGVLSRLAHMPGLWRRGILILSRCGGAEQGDGGKDQDGGEDSESFHAALSLPPLHPAVSWLRAGENTKRAA